MSYQVNVFSGMSVGSQLKPNQKFCSDGKIRGYSELSERRYKFYKQVKKLLNIICYSEDGKSEDFISDAGRKKYKGSIVKINKELDQSYKQILSEEEYIKTQEAINTLINLYQNYRKEYFNIKDKNNYEEILRQGRI